MSQNISPSANKFDFIIVGGGVYGICIAYYLSKIQKNQILLVQQFEIGHDKGSSHSPTRITRSTYQKELYRDLNLKALAQNWKQMEKILNQKFVYETPYIYYDQQEDSFLQYKKVSEGTDNFTFMTPQQVCKKYPGMPLIKSKYPPIVDLKAGILTADNFILKLKNFLKQNPNKNLTILQRTKVENITENNDGVTIKIDNGYQFNCRRAIISSGKWITQLLPQLKDDFKVIKQYVTYLQLKDMSKYDIDKFYSFYYKQTDQLHLFSMADHDKWGVKFGRHNLFSLKPEEDNFQYQKAFFQQKAKEIFGQEFIKINKIQNCYYTITPTHDFIIDFLNPSTSKILICSCCSGHGFKFSPIIGDIIAQIILEQDRLKSLEEYNGQKQTNNEVYNKWSHMFKFGYHRGLDLK